MARCRHCGKGTSDESLILCTTCGLTIIDDLAMAFFDAPPDGTLARVKYNRCLRVALKYLQEVSPIDPERRRDNLWEPVDTTFFELDPPGQQRIETTRAETVPEEEP